MLGQRLPPDWELEVLIGVDACAETGLVARELAGPRVRAFRSEANVGPYVIFNALRRHARGSQLTYHGADDEMVQGRLEMMIRRAAQPSPVPLLIATYFTDVDTELNEIKRHDRLADGAIMIPRQLLDRLGGFEAWRCAADTELIVRSMALGSRAVIIPKHLLLRRVHQGQLTASARTGIDSSERQRRTQEIKRRQEAWRMGEPVATLEPKTVELLPV